MPPNTFWQMTGMTTKVPTARNKSSKRTMLYCVRKLAPSSQADMAFLQHMFHHLEDGGTIAVVLPHGVLFRGAAEGHIRQFMIEKLNCIDAVIGLPANIFYGTPIATCVLVLHKCRKHNDSILFINASNRFEKVKTQNRLLPEHIDEIVNTYNDWRPFPEACWHEVGKIQPEGTTSATVRTGVLQGIQPGSGKDNWDD